MATLHPPMTPLQRIEFVCKSLFCTKHELAHTIGRSPETFYNIEKGRTKGISHNLARQIVEIYPQFSYDWLLNGIGEPINDGTNIQHISNSNGITQKGNVNIGSISTNGMEEELKTNSEVLITEIRGLRMAIERLEYQVQKLNKTLDK